MGSASLALFSLSIGPQSGTEKRWRRKSGAFFPRISSPVSTQNAPAASGTFRWVLVRTDHDRRDPGQAGLGSAATGPLYFFPNAERDVSDRCGRFFERTPAIRDAGGVSFGRIHVRQRISLPQKLRHSPRQRHSDSCSRSTLQPLQGGNILKIVFTARLLFHFDQVLDTGNLDDTFPQINHVGVLEQLVEWQRIFDKQINGWQLIAGVPEG